ncbi:MAG: SIR2 family protein [Terriglobia bacterium]
MSDQTVTFKKDEVIVLLGAGASVDAGVPHSGAMVEQIERALKDEWREFKDLYNYVRSAIFFADGIQGIFDTQVSYNIEKLVVALDELLRREEHPLYPFVGAWNPRLSQVAGENFQRVSVFRNKILEKLRHEWIEITNYEQAAYFKGLINFQSELNYPLRIFTLNYDLCVEKTYHCVYNEFPERGFDKSRFWNHELLEDVTQGQKNLYLYKLHGSIDWTRDPATGKITYSDSTSIIKVDDGVLIFGTTYKLQYVDPFLFLVYQLRRLSLDAKLLLVVGYGFGDEHINGILAQALRGSTSKRLLAVTSLGNLGDSEPAAKRNFRQYVSKQLELENIEDQRLVIQFSRAKEFLAETLTLAEMSKHFPPEEPIFEDVKSES